VRASACLVGLDVASGSVCRIGSELNLEKVGEERRRVRLEDGVVEEALQQEALERQVVLVQAPEPPLPPLQAPPRPQRVLVVDLK
jgi:hypothetical protein